MALSEPVARQHFHTRNLEIKGYKRDDGLWDIEGHLTDVRPFADEHREAGEPIHSMWLRLTIDGDFVVRQAEAFTAASPYEVCPATNGRYAALEGLRIGAGWTRRVKERVGGVGGCTHLTEMLGQMATAAMQTLWGNNDAPVQSRPDGRPAIIDTCHAWRADGPVVKRDYPDFYTGE